jgi:DNA-binding protein HU-beta
MIMSMNKQDLIDTIAAEAGITKTAAEAALNAFTGSVTATLQEGGRVAIMGFGSWETANRPARTGRNPQTGAPINIAAATVAKFRSGKALKEALNIESIVV